MILLELFWLLLLMFLSGALAGSVITAYGLWAERTEQVRRMRRVLPEVDKIIDEARRDEKD